MKKNIINLFILSLFSLSISCKAQLNQNNTNKDIESKVDSLLKLMTLEEKSRTIKPIQWFWDVTGPIPKEGSAVQKYENLKKGLVGSMLNVKGVKDVYALQKIAVEETRLGIPLLFGFDIIHGYKTISPIPLAEAASWDLNAIEKSAQMAADEASAVGINWTFAPMVDISRDARWGRVMEGAGEDPYLGSLIAKARVNGFQGDLSSNKNIIACAKHFAGYGFVEAGRDYNTVSIGPNILNNVIFPPFKAAKDANVKTFMNAFNDLNGEPSTGNYYLQREILKDKWNFKGFIVSDWGSIGEMINHGFAKDNKQAAEIAIKAGSDMDMESYAYLNHLVELVKENKVKVELIDDAVKRILRVKFELGIFENPYKYCDFEREKATVGKQEFRNEVLEMAKKSIVLLKNDNNLLPLKKEGLKIALIGQLAIDKTSPLGSWRIAADDETAVSVLEGMSNYKGNTLQFAKGIQLTNGLTEFMWETKINTNNSDGIDEAVALAKKVDVVVMVLGEHGLQSGEGRSRTELGLPGLQQTLLEKVYAVNPNIVLVLQNGRPLVIPWAAKNIPSIVEAWHLGTESGNAIAQVLYGDYNPSGKLPMTFPRNEGQLPLYYNHMNTGRPKMNEPESVFWSHYIDEENTPQFAFGHGLSYSKFEYSNLKLDKTSMNNSDYITATITLKNNSNVKGKEVVQLYIQDIVSSLVRPVKELIDFKIVELNSYESKVIEFKIDKEKLGFYNANYEWITEPGEFNLFIGGSSDTTLQTKFSLN